MVSKEEIQYLDPNKIRETKIKLRNFNISTAEGIEASTKSVGFLQNIIVRPIEKDGNYEYEAIFGDHRLRVAKKNDIKIPCIIRNVSDDEAALMAIVENSQRNTKTDPTVEGEVFDELCDKGWEIEQIAKKIGKGKVYVIERLRIYRSLHPKLLNKVSKREMSIEVAYNIAQHPIGEQIDVARKIRQEVKMLQSSKKCRHCPIHCPSVV